MNSITLSLKDLKDKANIEEEKEKTSSFLAKQDTLKSKVKESGVTLERTKDVFLFFSKLIILKNI